MPPVMSVPTVTDDVLLRCRAAADDLRSCLPGRADRTVVEDGEHDCLSEAAQTARSNCLVKLLLLQASLVEFVAAAHAYEATDRADTA